jgi:hypothetical protein
VVADFYFRRQCPTFKDLYPYPLWYLRAQPDRGLCRIFHVDLDLGEPHFQAGRRFSCTWFMSLCPMKVQASAHFFQSSLQITMKLSFAILSLAATASAFTPSAPARSVSRVGGSSVLAPVPVRAAGT